MRKGFSLVELITSFAVLALLLSIAVGAYRNIRQKAEDTAVDRNQRIMIQALEAFRATGGTISPILQDNTLRTNPKYTGQALLKVLEATAGASTRETHGTVGNLISGGFIVIPYGPAYGDPNGTTRLVVDSSGQNIILSTTGNGFLLISPSTVLASRAAEVIPVPKDDEGNPTITDEQISNAMTTAVTAAITPSSSGAKFADRSNYLWNEDTASYGSPESGSLAASTASTPPIVTFTSSPLIIAYRDSAGNSGRFNYNQYLSGSLELFVYRADRVPLRTTDATVAVTFTANGTTIDLSGKVTYQTVCAVNASTIVDGSDPSAIYPQGAYIKIDDLPTTLLPPNQWTQSQYSVSINATPTDFGFSRGIQSSIANNYSVQANPISLQPPTVSIEGGSLVKDAQIKVDAITAGTTPYNTGGGFTNTGNSGLVGPSYFEGTIPYVLDTITITDNKYAAPTGIMGIQNSTSLQLAYFQRIKQAPDDSVYNNRNLP